MHGSGQYASSKDSLVLFRDGRFDQLVDNGREACKGRTYQPSNKDPLQHESCRGCSIFYFQ
jgi:hypothetical protein